MDFTGAYIAGTDDGTVAGANLSYTTGFTASQLYSTADYQSGSLAGIGLSGNNLSSWVSAGATLCNANLSSSTLTSASFNGATLVERQPITRDGDAGVDFTGAYIAGTDDGTVAGANLSYTTGFTASQLYSTADYQSGSLAGIGLKRQQYVELELCREGPY